MPEKKPIITMTTDFGLKDPFVGIMKGVIMGINPDAQIIDISHNISRYNIFEASHVIFLSYKYFPQGTIHIVVVDPGVGSSRRALMVVTKDYYFIGPDNGVFTPIFEELKTDFLKVIHLTSLHYFLPVRGSTFHGRDIFAPAAAWLSKGIDSTKFGEQITDYVTISSIKSTIEDGRIIKGSIISIDGFGNAITNITEDNLRELTDIVYRDKFRIIYKGRELTIKNYYAEAEESSLSAIINSFGHLEIFVYKGSASEAFDIKIEDSISVMLID